MLSISKWGQVYTFNFFSKKRFFIPEFIRKIMINFTSSSSGIKVLKLKSVDLTFLVLFDNEKRLSLK